MKGTLEGTKPRNRGIKALVIILVLLIIVSAVLLTLKMLNKKEITPVAKTEDELLKVVIEPEPEPEPVIFAGTDRPIAVMIDNHKGAWPQANINQAYIVYEIIVEGGETRLMALFKGKNLEKIGPIRSARHYFLDYAMENDAIFVHYGQSPQAESDIGTYNINNINGLVQSSSDFWRDSSKSAPHNAVSSTEKILKIANNKEYRVVSDKESLLNYKAKEFDLDSEMIATEISLPISDLQKVKYEYDEEKKVYVRYARGTKQTDWITEEDITAKNIIITFADNYTLNDSENKGRQGLKNIGTSDGYYITNGKAIKITCTKEDKISKTVYKNEAGEIINVNDGNTFIQICPTDCNVEILPGIPEPVVDTNNTAINTTT